MGLAVAIGFILIICGFSILKDKTGVGLIMVIIGGGLLSAIAQIY